MAASIVEERKLLPQKATEKLPAEKTVTQKKVARKINEKGDFERVKVRRKARKEKFPEKLKKGDETPTKSVKKSADRNDGGVRKGDVKNRRKTAFKGGKNPQKDADEKTFVKAKEKPTNYKLTSVKSTKKSHENRKKLCEKSE